VFCLRREPQAGTGEKSPAYRGGYPIFWEKGKEKLAQKKARNPLEGKERPFFGRKKRGKVAARRSAFSNRGRSY